MILFSDMLSASLLQQTVRSVFVKVLSFFNYILTSDNIIQDSTF